MRGGGGGGGGGALSQHPELPKQPAALGVPHQPPTPPGRLHRGDPSPQPTRPQGGPRGAGAGAAETPRPRDPAPRAPHLPPIRPAAPAAAAITFDSAPGVTQGSAAAAAERGNYLTAPAPPPPRPPLAPPAPAGPAPAPPTRTRTRAVPPRTAPGPAGQGGGACRRTRGCSAPQRARMRAGSGRGGGAGVAGPELGTRPQPARPGAPALWPAQGPPRGLLPTWRAPARLPGPEPPGARQAWARARAQRGSPPSSGPQRPGDFAFDPPDVPGRSRPEPHSGSEAPSSPQAQQPLAAERPAPATTHPPGRPPSRFTPGNGRTADLWQRQAWWEGRSGVTEAGSQGRCALREAGHRAARTRQEERSPPPRSSTGCRACARLVCR